MKYVVFLLFAVGLSLGVAACQDDEDGLQQAEMEDFTTVTSTPTLTPTPDPTVEAELDRFDETYELYGQLCLDIGRQLAAVDNLVELSRSSPGVATLAEAFLAYC